MIQIDTREQGQRGQETTRKERAYKYYTHKGYDCQIKSLPTGDYVFNNNVVFEYKTIDDFMTSTFNGRLFDEVTNQTERYPYSYLIIEGHLAEYNKQAWRNYNLRRRYKNYNRFVKSNYATYTGSIRRVQTICPVIYAPNEEKAFQEMLLQSQKCNDKKRYGSIVKKEVKSESAVDAVLCSIKNISNKKAETIKQTHTIQNLNDLMSLTIKDFKQVPGIGEKTAINIYAFIHQGEI